MNLALYYLNYSHLSEYSSEYFLYLLFIKPIQKFLVWEVIAIDSSISNGYLSLAGGLIGSKSSKKPKRSKRHCVKRLTLINSVITTIKRCMAVLSSNFVNDVKQGVIAAIWAVVTARSLVIQPRSLKPTSRTITRTTTTRNPTRIAVGLNHGTSIRHCTSIGDSREISPLIGKRKT